MLQGAAGSLSVKPRAPASSPALSPRQREVLELLAEGIQARQIADRLGLSEATVRNHIRIVLRKLDSHSQLEAVAVAYRRDLLRRDEGGPGNDRNDRRGRSPSASRESLLTRTGSIPAPRTHEVLAAERPATACPAPGS
jgi:DNA-binding CsgD family transcriptional regulator